MRARGVCIAGERKVVGEVKGEGEEKERGREGEMQKEEGERGREEGRSTFFFLGISTGPASIYLIFLILVHYAALPNFHKTEFEFQESFLFSLRDLL